MGTEVEALQLEYTWIKEYDPRYNVRYRDDKSYPYLAVTLDEDYPRITVMRGQKRKGVRYFGPYSHAWAIRETVDLLLRVFPMRSCSFGVFKNARAAGRHCLLGYIGKCSAPCVGRITPEAFVFPYDDDVFDVAHLSSVFTHLLPTTIDHYLREINRVLRPGGRCVSTFFVLNDPTRAATPEHREVWFDHEGPAGCRRWQAEPH